MPGVNLAVGASRGDNTSHPTRVVAEVSKQRKTQPVFPKGLFISVVTRFWLLAGTLTE
jgi:hypothetical protein